MAAEFAELVAAGAYEVCLIGQDLGSYGRDRGGKPLLPALLAAISAVPGDWRLRMLYIHPDRFPREILAACAADSRILPYFDIPFQHAAEPVLRAMNRSGGAEQYLGLIRDIRAALPGAVIRSTFLVGFPGETDADFAALRRFQDEARLDWLGAFAYSREEDTPAYEMKSRVPKRVALARKTEIEDAQRLITEAALSRWVGTDQTVLVEERIEGEDLAIARGPMNAPEGRRRHRDRGREPEARGTWSRCESPPCGAWTWRRCPVPPPDSAAGLPDYLEGLNPEQRQAVTHERGNLLILAGAGSGKTRVITTKIAWLIRERGYAPESILAVTFTNKAAAEMRERACSIEPACARANLRTFHSFGAWFLRRNAEAAGLDRDFTIYDDDDSHHPRARPACPSCRGPRPRAWRRLSRAPRTTASRPTPRNWTRASAASASSAAATPSTSAACGRPATWTSAT